MHYSGSFYISSSVSVLAEKSRNETDIQKVARFSWPTFSTKQMIPKNLWLFVSALIAQEDAKASTAGYV